MDEIEVLRYHLGTRTGKVHADGWHLTTEVVDVEAQFFEVGLLPPEHPPHAGEHTSVFMPAGVDRFHTGQAKVPAQLGERRGNNPGSAINMDRHIESRLLLQLIQPLLDRSIGS